MIVHQDNGFCTTRALSSEPSETVWQRINLFLESKRRTLNSSCFKYFMCGASSFITSSVEVICGCSSSEYEAVLFINSKVALIWQALTNPIPFTFVSCSIEAVNRVDRFLSNAWSKFEAIWVALHLSYPGETNRASISSSDKSVHYWLAGDMQIFLEILSLRIRNLWIYGMQHAAISSARATGFLSSFLSIDEKTAKIECM